MGREAAIRAECELEGACAGYLRRKRRQAWLAAWPWTGLIPCGPWTSLGFSLFSQALWKVLKIKSSVTLQKQHIPLLRGTQAQGPATNPLLRVISCHFCTSVDPDLVSGLCDPHPLPQTALGHTRLPAYSLTAGHRHLGARKNLEKPFYSFPKAFFPFPSPFLSCSRKLPLHSPGKVGGKGQEAGTSM